MMYTTNSHSKKLGVGVLLVVILGNDWSVVCSFALSVFSFQANAPQGERHIKISVGVPPAP